MQQTVASRHGLPTAVRQRSCRYLVRHLQALGSTGRAYRSSRGLLGAWSIKWTRSWVLVSSRGSANVSNCGRLAAVDRGRTFLGCPSTGPMCRKRCHDRPGVNVWTIYFFINILIFKGVAVPRRCQESGGRATAVGGLRSDTSGGAAGQNHAGSPKRTTRLSSDLD